MNPHKLIDNGFEIPAIRMQPYWRIRFLAPVGEIDALFDEIIRIVKGKIKSLSQGFTYATFPCAHKSC